MNFGAGGERISPCASESDLQSHSEELIRTVRTLNPVFPQFLRMNYLLIYACFSYTSEASALSMFSHVGSFDDITGLFLSQDHVMR